MSRDRSNGYAMLAALLIVAVVATFAAVVVGAVHAVQVVDGADASGWRADRARAQALAAVLVQTRWSPWTANGTLDSSTGAGGSLWRAEWDTLPTVPIPGWPRRDVRVSGTSGQGTRGGRSTLEVRAEPWATGVTCAGDVEAGARLQITGSGLYAGGCVRARENVVFAAGAESVTPYGSPADLARPEEFEVASVHATAIFAAGVETHDPASAVAYPDDTDQHTGGAVPASWVEGPSAEFLVAARAFASAPGSALADGTLHLDAMPPRSATEAAFGRCVVVEGADEVTIVGSLPTGSAPLLIVVPGDAVVGQPGESVTLDGGLVVGGRLRLRGGLRLDGPLHAGSLEVAAPASINLPAAWRLVPLPGAARPVVVEDGT